MTKENLKNFEEKKKVITTIAEFLHLLPSKWNNFEFTGYSSVYYGRFNGLSADHWMLTPSSGHGSEKVIDWFENYDEIVEVYKKVDKINTNVYYCTDYHKIWFSLTAEEHAFQIAKAIESIQNKEKILSILTTFDGSHIQSKEPVNMRVGDLFINDLYITKASILIGSKDRSLGDIDLYLQIQSGIEQFDGLVRLKDLITFVLPNDLFEKLGNSGSPYTIRQYIIDQHNLPLITENTKKFSLPSENNDNLVPEKYYKSFILPTKIFYCVSMKIINNGGLFAHLRSCKINDIFHISKLK